MENDITKEYELAILAESEAVETEIDKLLADLPEGGQVEILNKEPARLLTLAYPINKHLSATLLVYQLRTQPENIAKIRESLRFQPNVLRHLLITPPIQKLNAQKTRERPSEMVAATISPPAKPVGPEISSNELLTKTLEQLENNESK